MASAIFINGVTKFKNSVEEGVFIEKTAGEYQALKEALEPSVSLSINERGMTGSDSDEELGSDIQERLGFYIIGGTEHTTGDGVLLDRIYHKDTRTIGPLGPR